jgi:glutamate dehydrogenase/leucine dehydrogenase
MQRAFRDVITLAGHQKCNLRTAALIRGIDRVKEAKRRRGVFP